MLVLKYSYQHVCASPRRHCAPRLFASLLDWSTLLPARRVARKRSGCHPRRENRLGWRAWRIGGVCWRARTGWLQSMLCLRVTLGSLCVESGLECMRPAYIDCSNIVITQVEIAGSGSDRFLGCELSNQGSAFGLNCDAWEKWDVGKVVKVRSDLQVSSILVCPAFFKKAALPGPSRTRVAVEASCNP